MKKFLEITGFVLSCIWECIMSITAPVCIGFIFMNITGHGKGYDYDLRAEKDINIFLGVVMLAIWLGLLVPNSIFLFQRLKSFGWRYVLIGFMVLVIFFIAGILVTGGFPSFLAYFNVKV